MSNESRNPAARRRAWLLLPPALLAASLRTLSVQRPYLSRLSDAADPRSSDARRERRSLQRDGADGVEVGGAFEVERCTPEQLATIGRQLPPDDCARHLGEPWKQRCSLTYATRCPDATWLADHHAERHRRRSANGTSSAVAAAAAADPFLGVFVGCNKGFDAVDALRMGSGSAAFDRSDWADAMTDVYRRGRPVGKAALERDVCNQATSPQFALPEDGGGGGGHPPARVHCIEPMPATVRALQRAAWKLQYDRRGLVVTHAALSREDGTVKFPRGESVGKEKVGIGSTNCVPGKQACTDVAAYSLESYANKYLPEGQPIDYLSVDAEGHDHDVLFGNGTARSAVLSRVRYLEFEYNWMGPWAGRSLRRAIETLDEDYGLRCYWAGFNGTIWRITGCWLDHYDLHFWSNVACVDPKGARGIAERMEAMFLDTLAGGEANVRDFEHRFQRKD